MAVSHYCTVGLHLWCQDEETESANMKMAAAETACKCGCHEHIRKRQARNQYKASKRARKIQHHK